MLIAEMIEDVLRLEGGEELRVRGLETDERQWRLGRSELIDEVAIGGERARTVMHDDACRASRARSQDDRAR